MRVATLQPVLTVLALLVLLVPGNVLVAGELRVAVAANFLATLQQLATSYERASGTRLLPSAASSGQLFAQINQGAPFDVFLSADSERPQQLERIGLAEPGSRFTYAVGKLVLWSPRVGEFADGAAYLRGASYRYLAIANPEVAPYGLAAQQLLQKLQLWDSLRAARKIVTGASLAQTQQFADVGSADAAFIAWSQLLVGKRRLTGSYWIPDATLYQPILQQAVVLSASSSKAEARHFMAWLRYDPAAVSTLRAAGYGQPAE